MIITIAQLHSTKPELRFCAGSDPAHGVSDIDDGEDLWQLFWLEIRLNPFISQPYHKTIHHHHHHHHFTEYSQTINVYENLRHYNPIKKRIDRVWWYDSRYGSLYKNKFCGHWIVFKRKKTQYFACLYFNLISKWVKL